MNRLPTFPQLRSHVMKVTIGDKPVRYRRVYHSRLNAWYIDILNERDEPFLLGARLNPGTFVGGALPVELPATLYVRGPDDYEQTDLGGRLREYVINDEDLPEEEDGIDHDDFIEEIALNGGEK